MSDVTTWLTPTSLFLLLNFVIGTIFLISRSSTPTKPPPHHDAGYHSSPPPLQRAPKFLDRVKSVNFSTFKFSLPNQDYYYEDHQDHHHHPQVQQHVDAYLAPHPLERAPSILERVKSINFSLHKYPPQNPDHPVVEQQPALTRPPSLLERVKSIDFKSYYRSDPVKLNPETEDPGSENHTTTPVHSPAVKRSKSEYDNVKKKKNPEKMKKSASEKFEDEDPEEELERRRPATTRIEKTSFGDDDHGVDAKADDFIYKFKQQLKLQRLDSLLRYRDMLKSKPS